MGIVNTRHTPLFDPEDALTSTELAFIQQLSSDAGGDADALPIISTGTSAPATTPTTVGDIFVDTTNDNVYMAVGTASSADWVQINGGGGGYTNLTQFVDQTAHRFFYSDANGDVTELAFGADGTFLKSNGATSAPSFATPAGSGDVVGPASAVDDNIATFDTTTGKLIQDGGASIAGVRDRSTHTGTQTASTISDFDTEVSNNTNVAANTTYRGVGHIPLSQKGANNGVAELDAGGKVPSAQLPSFVDDVLEYADLASFPATGETGKIYVAQDTNIVYRWSGSAYVEISASLALGETSSTAYRGDRGKIAYDHSQVTTGNPHNVTKAEVGLSNVPNVDARARSTHTGTQLLSTISDVTATAAEVNKLDGVAGDVVGTTDTQTLTNKTLGGTLNANNQDITNTKLVEFNGEVDNGNSGTADTIDWGAGNMQKSTLTGNCTYTFTAPSGPARLQLKLIQDATGSRIPTFPASVKWPGGSMPTFTTAANAVDIVTFWFDESDYYGVASLDFS